MKLVSLAGITAYRMHTPRWAVSPTSGEGAARHGGRANRPSVDALYLSLDTQTAIHEYQQVSTLLPPGTLTSYVLTVNPVIDFTNGYSASEWPLIWEDFYCDWRQLWFEKRIEPPSWIAGDVAIASGAKGILFLSNVCAGGKNLVLFNGSMTDVDSLKVHDPNNALPKNQSSWM
jgi:RES domain-containing protein